MNRKSAIIGIDPSSRKVATVTTTRPETEEFNVSQVGLPEKNPEKTSLKAYEYVYSLVKTYMDQGYVVYVFIEAPTLIPRAGARSLIPQAQVSGALMAGAGSAGASVSLVAVAEWKKRVIGKGNVGKPVIKRWCAEYWPTLYKQHHKDQDVLDAAAINRYGNMVSRLAAKMTVVPTLKRKP